MEWKRDCSVFECHPQRTYFPHAAILFFLSLLLSLPASLTEASAGGRSGFSGKPGTNAGAVCTVCHAPGGATTPFVGIVGPSSMNAGTTQNFFVAVQGGPGITGGVDIAAGGGKGRLQPAGGDLRLLDGELTHSAPKPFVDGVVAFVFRYTAPNYNTTVTLYGAGNSTNNRLDLLGDGVAHTNFTITVRNGFQPPPPPPQPAQGELEAVLLTTGLTQPVAIAHAGDGRLFVVERRGVIRILDQQRNLVPTPFLDIRSRVDPSGTEMGLLGLAFHPNFASNGFFYVNYTRDPGAGLDRTRVSRFTVSQNRNIANVNSEKVLLAFEQPFANHNGGDLQFGPDGFLYIASGDGGSIGDPQNNGQRTNTLLGKILRINVDGVAGPNNNPDCDISGQANYRIPAGNAFTDGDGGAGCDEIFVLGVRNPWRFTFDRETGAMWVADVGQNEYEEINYINAGSTGGINLGWRCYEGDSPFNLAGCHRDYLPPVHTYAHADGGCSVTGGRVYRGWLYPVLEGQYFFTDFCQASIRALSGPPGALSHREVLPTGALASPSTFGEDALGELYIAELHTGSIYHLRAVLTPGDVYGDGDVDFDDIVVIWLSRGQNSSSDEDRRDVDGNGRIETADVNIAVSNCTRPACAVEVG